MELRAQDGQSTFTAERAAQSLDYWRKQVQQILSDPAADAALKSYSHNANSAANLLAAHNFTSEAEQAYRFSRQLWPDNPEPVAGLAAILERAGRADEVRQMLEEFYRNHPKQRSAVESINFSVSLPASAAQRSN